MGEQSIAGALVKAHIRTALFDVVIELNNRVIEMPMTSALDAMRIQALQEVAGAIRTVAEKMDVGLQVECQGESDE